jgi:hypothetical protein
MSAQKPTPMVSTEDLHAHIRSHTSLEVSSGSTTPKDASGTTTPNYSESASGVHIIDEGEKDKNGKVILASKEPCETCGGKVVWATMGQFLMVCQGCGEP